MLLSSPPHWAATTLESSLTLRLLSSPGFLPHRHHRMLSPSPPPLLLFTHLFIFPSRRSRHWENVRSGIVSPNSRSEVCRGIYGLPAVTQPLVCRRSEPQRRRSSCPDKSSSRRREKVAVALLSLVFFSPPRGSSVSPPPQLVKYATGRRRRRTA